MTARIWITTDRTTVHGLTSEDHFVNFEVQDAPVHEWEPPARFTLRMVIGDETRLEQDVVYVSREAGDHAQRKCGSLTMARVYAEMLAQMVLAYNHATKYEDGPVDVGLDLILAEVPRA